MHFEGVGDSVDQVLGRRMEVKLAELIDLAVEGHGAALFPLHLDGMGLMDDPLGGRHVVHADLVSPIVGGLGRDVDWRLAKPDPVEFGKEVEVLGRLMGGIPVVLGLVRRAACAKRDANSKAGQHLGGRCHEFAFSGRALKPPSGRT